MTEVRWLFFDLDGTLADSLPGLQASLAEALGSGGRRLRVSDVRPFIGSGIRSILKALENNLTETEIDGMERSFRASYDTVGVRNSLLFEDVRQTLQALGANGTEMFLVTNKPRLATANLMEQHGIAGLFKEMLSRDSRQPPFTSKAEMLRELLVQYEVNAQRALMVGDTAEDQQAAQQAGMRFAFAEYGYGQIEDQVECIRLSRFSEIAQACALSGRGSLR